MRQAKKLKGTGVNLNECLTKKNAEIAENKARSRQPGQGLERRASD